jgi:hypothetical protein
MRSMLRDWVMELPLREQGTLMAAMRGCDLTPKYPLVSTERQLVAYFRFVVCIPNDPREVDFEPGVYMQSEPPTGWRASELGHYPLHWYSHLMHGYEVAAYRGPDEVACVCYPIYCDLVDALHLQIETREEMIARLSEDRVARGQVAT